MSQKNFSTTSLEYLGVDILHQICTILSERTIRINTWGSKSNLERKSLPDLVALSSTNKALRRLSEPMMFDDLFILQSYDEGKKSWEQVAHKLEILNRDIVRILGFVKNFTITITESYKSPCGPFIPTIPTLLATTLSHLSTTLQTLTFEIPRESIPDFTCFTEAFRAQGTILPLVQNLVLGPFADFLIAHCPNVRSVHMTSDYHGRYNTFYAPEGNLVGPNLIESVLRAGTVTSLRFLGGWSVQMVRALAAQPTNPLTTLSELRPRHDVHIHDLIKALSPLENLQVLELGNLTNLEVGFEPPECGNAYMGRNGRAVWSAVVLQMRELEAQILGVVEGAFGEGRRLREVSFGGDCACFERKEVGGEMGNEEEEEGWWREGVWVRLRRAEDDDVMGGGVAEMEEGDDDDEYGYDEF